MENCLLVFYRCFTFLIGLAITWMGYRLFTAGIFGQAGNTVWGNNYLLLKRAAPGAVFVLAGLTVIAVSLSKPLEFHVTGESRDIYLSQPAEPRSPPKT